MYSIVASSIVRLRQDFKVFTCRSFVSDMRLGHEFQRRVLVLLFGEALCISLRHLLLVVTEPQGDHRGLRTRTVIITFSKRAVEDSSAKRYTSKEHHGVRYELQHPARGKEGQR